MYKACLNAGVRVRLVDASSPKKCLYDVRPIRSVNVTEYQMITSFPSQLRMLLRAEGLLVGRPPSGVGVTESCNSNGSVDTAELFMKSLVNPSRALR